MAKDDELFSGPSVFDLRGKQSVRATFRLSQKAIDALGLVAVHMGIKQKSLFDHIIEDMEALDDLARSIRIRQFEKIPRRQKTFVLSRRTVDALASISQSHGMPRDALVEYSIKKLEAIIQAERRRHQERKKLRQALLKHVNEGEALYASAAKALGPDDPFCRKMERSVLAARKTLEDIDLFLEKSMVLEDF